MLTELTKKLPESCSRFYCENCDYKTDKKSSYTKHLNTTKHFELTFSNKKLLESCPDVKHICERCSTEYKSRVGLWKHKKTCVDHIEPTVKKVSVSEDILLEMMQQNNDLKQMLLEQNNAWKESNEKLIENNNKLANLASEGKYITNNTQNNFNLNFFLNEKCKNAISITDFINSLQIGINELELTGQLGYAEGLSRIFIEGLNGLDVCERPIHCSNLRNEVLYVKAGDEWTKEDENRSNLSLAIKELGKKNITQIFEWQKKYPDFKDPYSKQNDKYQNLLVNVMSGSTVEEQQKNMNKIIRNISKQVVIDKKLNL